MCRVRARVRVDASALTPAVARARSTRWARCGAARRWCSGRRRRRRRACTPRCARARRTCCAPPRSRPAGWRPARGRRSARSTGATWRACSATCRRGGRPAAGARCGGLARGPGRCGRRSNPSPCACALAQPRPPWPGCVARPAADAALARRAGACVGAGGRDAARAGAPGGRRAARAGADRRAALRLPHRARAARGARAPAAAAPPARRAAQRCAGLARAPCSGGLEPTCLPLATSTPLGVF